jgi:hypothetical protein
VRRIYSAWGDDPRGNYIPGDYEPPSHPDTYDMQQAPTSLNPPDGHPTFNFDRVSGTIIARFNKYEVDPDLIRRAVNTMRKEHGVDAVKFIDVLVSAETMAGPLGVWLCHEGYERQPDATAKTALYRWRKAVKPPKKNEEGKCP